MKVIALIGSARFHKVFMRVEEALTLNGNCVLLPFWFGLTHKEIYGEEIWDFFMKSAFKKIELAERIVIIDQDNVGSYVGAHTQREIDYALSLKKEVIYYSETVIWYDEKHGDKDTSGLMKCVICGGVLEKRLKVIKYNLSPKLNETRKFWYCPKCGKWDFDVLIIPPEDK